MLPTDDSSRYKVKHKFRQLLKFSKEVKIQNRESTLSRQRKATKISFAGSSLHEDHQVYVYVSKNFIIQDIKSSSIHSIYAFIFIYIGQTLNAWT